MSKDWISVYDKLPLEENFYYGGKRLTKPFKSKWRVLERKTVPNNYPSDWQYTLIECKPCSEAGALRKKEAYQKSIHSYKRLKP